LIPLIFENNYIFDESKTRPKEQINLPEFWIKSQNRISKEAISITKGATLSRNYGFLPVDTVPLKSHNAA